MTSTVYVYIIVVRIRRDRTSYLEIFNVSSVLLYFVRKIVSRYDFSQKEKIVEIWIEK